MPTKKKSKKSDKKDVKICPYCANELKAWAKKCKYCKESLFEEKDFYNEDEEIKQENNKTKKVWWRILALSIPIIWITWLIVSLIFYIIGVSTGGWSELMFTIKKAINWMLWILCFLSFFLTIRWIVILSRSWSKSNWLIQDGDEMEPENIKTSIKAWKITKYFMIWYIVWVGIDFLLAFTWGDLSEWVETLLNFIFSIWAFVSQIVWGYKTYKWLQIANIKWLTFPKWWWWLVFWWICPIACLYMPYQIVRDIVHTYKLKTWRTIKKSFFWTIVWRWRGVYLIGGMVASALFRETWEWYVWLILISYMFDIVEYILFIRILTITDRMQKECLGIKE